MGSSYWFLDQNNFFYLFLHFSPRGTTRVGNLLFCSKSLILKSNCEQFAQITHDKRATVSELHRLLTKNEQPWAIHSGHSPKMSNCEQNAQVAHDKRATRANRSFFLSESLFHLHKTSDSLKNIWIKSFFVRFLQGWANVHFKRTQRSCVLLRSL